MDDLNLLPPDAVNPATRSKHRREVLWQITVPATIVILMLVILSWLFWNAQPGKQSQWADISVIMMTIPMLLVALITVVIQAASIYALVRLIKVLPVYSFRGFNLLVMIGWKAGTIEDKIVRPFVEVRAFKASVRTFGRSLVRTGRRK
jgi:hypothetical protein